MENIRYYKNQERNTFVKRLSDEHGYHVQLIKYDNGDFTNVSQRKHWGSKENFDAWLSDFKECTEEEFEVWMSQYCLKQKEHAKVWLDHRMRKIQGNLQSNDPATLMN